MATISPLKNQPVILPEHFATPEQREFAEQLNADGKLTLEWLEKAAYVSQHTNPGHMSMVKEMVRIATEQTAQHQKPAGTMSPMELQIALKAQQHSSTEEEQVSLAVTHLSDKIRQSPWDDLWRVEMLDTPKILKELRLPASEKDCTTIFRKACREAIPLEKIVDRIVQDMTPWAMECAKQEHPQMSFIHIQRNVCSIAPWLTNEEINNASYSVLDHFREKFSLWTD